MSLAWNCLLFPLAIYFPVSVLSSSWNPLQWDKLQCRGFSTCHSVFHLMAVRSELDGCSAYCSSYEEINYEISREKTAAIGQRRDRGGQMAGDVGKILISRLTGVLLGRMLPVLLSKVQTSINSCAHLSVTLACQSKPSSSAQFTHFFHTERFLSLASLRRSKYRLLKNNEKKLALENGNRLLKGRCIST